MLSTFRTVRQAENPRQAAYDAKLADLTGKAQDYVESQVTGVLDLLRAAQKDVLSAVAGTDWDTYHNAERKKAIEEAIKTFEAKAKDFVSESQRELIDAGIDIIDEPMAAAGVDVKTKLPAFPPENLNIMVEYSADLITNVSDDAITKINGVISRAITGGLTLQEAIDQIGRNLDSPGVFRSIANRAEFIARTEMARVNNAARQARANQLSGMFPELNPQKKWIHSGKPKKTRRRNHYKVDGEIVPVDEKFSNGIDYPHAPGLPAKEVVNCGCTHVLVMDWDAAGKDFPAFEKLI